LQIVSPFIDPVTSLSTHQHPPHLRSNPCRRALLVINQSIVRNLFLEVC
jgi:hypothetical protein